MKTTAKTVRQYLDSLPADRRAALEAVRKVIRANLDPAYQETIQYGMIGWSVPHSVYPAGYHCDPRQPLPFASLASQKNHMAVYLMCLYGFPEHEEWFRKEWAKSGKRLDMGRSCIRFRKVEDLALDVLGEAVRRVPARAFIEHYEAAVRDIGKRRGPGGGTRAGATAKKGATRAKAGKKPAARRKTAAGRASTR